MIKIGMCWFAILYYNPSDLVALWVRGKSTESVIYGSLLPVS